VLACSRAQVQEVKIVGSLSSSACWHSYTQGLNDRDHASKLLFASRERWRFDRHGSLCAEEQCPGLRSGVLRSSVDA